VSGQTTIPVDTGEDGLAVMRRLLQGLPIPARYRNVRPLPPEFRFWRKVFRGDGCWYWTAGANEQGYGLFNRSPAKAGNCWLAHRYSYELHYGPFDERLCVLHDCDTPNCVRPDHLFLGTRTDNAEDKVSKGRQRGPQGERNPKAALTEAEVLAIRAEFAAGGVSKSEIARRRRIPLWTVRNILSETTWRHLLEDNP
jgi:hypothetical protein